jgi:dipeptidyl aminopeptidase/acylaminoacyl peptidase
LAAAGIASLCVNADFALAEESYPSGGIAARSQHARLQITLDSWEAAVNVLGDRGLIDPLKVGISGLSFGAAAVHYAISHSSVFYVASASHPPHTDPFSYYLFATGERESIYREIYGLPVPAKDVGNIYQRVSPALNVSNIKTPILIQTDEGEFRFGLQYYANMVTSKKPIEFIVFPDEAHQFVQPIHLLVRNERYIDWFRYWLKGYEDPDPVKADQYLRWKELRRLRDSSARAKAAN